MGEWIKFAWEVIVAIISTIWLADRSWRWLVGRTDRLEMRMEGEPSFITQLRQAQRDLSTITERVNNAAMVGSEKNGEIQTRITAIEVAMGEVKGTLRSGFEESLRTHARIDGEIQVLRKQILDNLVIVTEHLIQSRRN